MMDKKQNKPTVRETSAKKPKPGNSNEKKLPSGGHVEASEIGVLLVDNASGAPISFIKFDSSGVLVYQMIETGMHVFAFKPINRLLSEQWINEPLYEKHAMLLDENSKLPVEILEQEANSCAEFLNALTSPLTLGEHIVKAYMVNFGSKGESHQVW